MEAKEAFRSAEKAYWKTQGIAPQERFVDLGAPKLRCRVLEQGQGAPVLFLHGGGACGSSCAGLVARTSGRCIFPDRPGFGLSDDFAYRDVDLRAHAIDFVGSLLDACGVDRATLVGNSIGGTWALWFAMAKPERVSSLVLAGAPPGLPDAMPPLFMRLLSIGAFNRLVLRKPPSPDRMRQIFEDMGHDRKNIDETLTAFAVATGSLPNYARAWGTLLESVLRIGGLRLPIAATDLANVRVPTLFVWGARDTHASVEVGRRACELVPRGRFELVDAGHLPWLDAPDVTASHVKRFISDGLPKHVSSSAIDPLEAVKR